MLRLLLVLAPLLALTACQTAPATDASPSSADTTHRAMDHDAMGHGASGASSYTDVGFLDHMTMHHRMAVDMAQTAVAKASSPEVREMAQQMVADQQREIAQMQAWRRQWFPDAPAPDTTLSADDLAAMGMAMDMGSLDRVTGPAYDQQFLEQMIPHHAGAITMAAQARAASQRAEVQALASQIIAAQAAEIGTMQQMREATPGA